MKKVFKMLLAIGLMTTAMIFSQDLISYYFDSKDIIHTINRNMNVLFIDYVGFISSFIGCIIFFVDALKTDK